MNDRIKKIRKESGKTQEEFASSLNLSRNFITQMETGTKNPSDRTIKDICREYHINEEWIRYGKGNMRIVPDDETASIVSDLLENENPLYDVIKSIARTYQALDPDSKKVLDNYISEFMKEIKGED